MNPARNTTEQAGWLLFSCDFYPISPVCIPKVMPMLIPTTKLVRISNAEYLLTRTGHENPASI